RTLGKTGWTVSAVSFGAWNVGGQWGDVSDATAIDTIKAAYDAGVNFFDVADAYGTPPGRSEELVAKALKPVRDKVLVATKVGNFGRRQEQPLPYTSPLHVELCCDASLHRLKTDVIDLYQCHIANLQDYSIFLEAFESLKKRGKIRFYGVSTNDVEALKRFNRDGNCATVQTDYSFLHRTAEQGLLPYAKEHQIGVIVRGPLAQGVCAGKFSPDAQFTDQVRLKWNEGPGRERFLQRLAVVDQVRFLDTPIRSMAQAALQFVISHSAVSCAIPGAKSPEQARANSAAGVHQLEPAELEKLRAATTTCV
ncbi:MAG: aldo/keto reductase, partial [Anaerolineae bacterium]|nr:aldo/keto reductase [Phycisphaerae bacterium]